MTQLGQRALASVAEANKQERKKHYTHGSANSGGSQWKQDEDDEVAHLDTPDRRPDEREGVHLVAGKGVRLPCAA